MIKSLKQLAVDFNTDKETFGESHQYCDFYDFHLSALRFEKLKILEIGIFKGASLRIWQEYFENSQIFGIDNLMESEATLINENRISSFKVDAGDRDSLIKFLEDYGPFDVIIDDASHFTNHQWLSWDLLSDKCKIFIWEDLHSSRIPHYMRGYDVRGYPLDYAKKLSTTDKNCYFYDKDNDEKHVTFLKKNDY